MIHRWTCALLVMFFSILTILPVHGIGEAGTGYNPVTAETEGIFSPVGWLSEPVTAIAGYLHEGQSIIGILAPFLAIVVLGIVIVVRRERKKGMRQPLLFWLAKNCRAGLPRWSIDHLRSDVQGFQRSRGPLNQHSSDGVCCRRYYPWNTGNANGSIPIPRFR
jgi:hypothetical protein